eukprot:8143068-Pyramimonas_sp.AAC.1
MHFRRSAWIARVVARPRSPHRSCARSAPKAPPGACSPRPAGGIPTCADKHGSAMGNMRAREDSRTSRSAVCVRELPFSRMAAQKREAHRFSRSAKREVR